MPSETARILKIPIILQILIPTTHAISRERSQTLVNTRPGTPTPSRTARILKIPTLTNARKHSQQILIPNPDNARNLTQTLTNARKHSSRHTYAIEDGPNPENPNNPTNPDRQSTCKRS